MYHSTNITTDNLFQPMERQITLMFRQLLASIKEYDGQKAVDARAGGVSLHIRTPETKLIPKTVREYDDIWLDLVETLYHWEKLTGSELVLSVPVSHLENPPLNIPE